MSAAFEVHNVIGGGLLEDIYQECMEIELRLRGIPFTGKPSLPVYYKGHLLSKTYIPDLFFEKSHVAELKSVARLLPEHEAQLLNYMRLARIPVGYLINFGPIEKVEWKRFVIDQFHEGNQEN